LNKEKLSLVDYITYISLKIFSKLLSLFSRKTVIILGRSFGFLMYVFFPLRKKVAKINLNIVFPNKNNKEIHSIIRKTYMHYGILMFELIKLHNYKPENYIFDLNVEAEKVLLSGEGLIFMTAHIGNWEMLMPIMSKFKKVTLVVRKQRNLGAHRFFSECRGIPNVSVISKKGSREIMYDAINNGELLWLASDQNAKDRGIYLNFFGKSASFPKGAGHFHYTSGKRIIIGFCILNKNYTYKFILKEIQLNKNYEQKDDMIVEINKIYIKLLEKEIKKYPEQYFWFHKKWDKEIYKL